MSRPAHVAVLLVLVLSGCPARNEAPSAGVRSSAAAPPPTLPRGPGVAVQGPPEALRSRLAGAYALRLDRRFLLAFDELAVLVRGQPCPAPAAAALAAERWTVTVCGEPAGTLPQDPDFPEALRALEALARKLGPTAPATAVAAQAPLPLLSVDEALARAVRIERAAPPYAPGEVHALSSALAALSFAMIDGLEVADGLRARGLAALALDRALGREDTAQEEALLAMSLGYEAAARAVAERLKPRDPLRAYLARDDGTLAGLAQPGASEAVQLLWLRRRVELEDDTAEAARGPRAPLGLALERARMKGFGVGARAGVVLTRLVLSPRVVVPARWRWNGGVSLAQLERVLAQATPSEQQFLRACFFDAVALRTDFALESRAVAAEGDAVLGELGEARPGTAEDGLRKWLALRVDVENRVQRAAETIEAISALPGVGGHPRATLLSLLGRQLDHGDPAFTAARRRLVEVLDGRPRHRVLLAVASIGEPDPRLREESVRRAARLAGDVGSRAGLAKLDGDVATLRALAGDAHLRDGLRASAIWLLHAENGDDVEAERLQRGLLSTTQDDFAVRMPLVQFLEERRRWVDAEALLTEWLDRGHPDRDLRGPTVRAALARVRTRQGRDAEALSAVVPALRSWKLDALREGGIAFARVHREADARAVVEAIAGRYQSVHGRAARAAVLWALRDADGAAAVVAEPSPRPIFDWADHFAPTFVDAFEDDPAAAAAAFAALQRARIDPIALAHVPGVLHVRHRDELAAELAVTLRHPDPIGDLELAIAAYRYLDAARGRERAHAWLTQRVPPPLRAPLSMFAFAEERDELFWDLVPAPIGQSENDDFTWLMFAAASLRAPPSPAHASALAARFAPVRPGFYHHLGRFLLGFEDQQQAVAMATSGKRVCEASFYVGLKAEAGGDLATAADWYRAGIENGTPRDGEYRWASERLTRWIRADRSLERLARETGPGGKQEKRPTPQ